MKKLYILLGCAVMVWLIVQFPTVMISPGDLISDHQKSNDKCFECHDAFGGISNEKCISCHKLDEIGLHSPDSSTLFHNKLNNVNCVNCHTDHKGIHPTGITSAFHHEMLDEETRLNCGSCHSSPSDELHPMLSAQCGSCHNTNDWKSVNSFNHDYIIETERNSCKRCHATPTDAFHSANTGQCSDCHGTDHWVPSTFDHSEYFVFDKHHTTQCSTCHVNNDYTAFTCYGCHEHSEAKIREEHLEEGITDFQNCASCHRSGDEDEAKGKHNSEQSGKNDAKKIEQYLNENGKHDQEDDD